jgi:Transferrin receptor-like dimerisation domain.
LFVVEFYVIKIVICYRHVVFSPSSFDAYEGGGFPGILDLLYKLSNDKLIEERKQELSNMLKKHVSDILVHIVQATHMLRSI